jgi:hypothetical protein
MGSYPSSYEMAQRRQALLRPLEIEANRSGFAALGALVEAVNYWDDDPKLYESVLEANVVSGMRELRDFLSEMPERYGYQSAVDYVLGYSPAGTALEQDDEAALRTYNHFQSRSLRLSKPRDHHPDMSPQGGGPSQIEVLRMDVGGLLEQVAKFTAQRHAMAQLTQMSRLRAGRATFELAPFGKVGADDSLERREQREQSAKTPATEDSTPAI